MGFSRQEYWSGLPCLPPRDLPYPGIKLESPVSPELAGGFYTASTTGKTRTINNPNIYFLKIKIYTPSETFSSVQSLNRVWLFATPWITARTPGVHSDLCPLGRWRHPAISSSVVPFSSHLQSLDDKFFVLWLYFLYPKKVYPMVSFKSFRVLHVGLGSSITLLWFKFCV